MHKRVFVVLGNVRININATLSTMKYFKTVACYAALFIAAFTVNAQVYPYWDAAEPTLDSHDGLQVAGSLLASGDALYTVEWNVSTSTGGGGISCWTKYGGWQNLPGLGISNCFLSAVTPPMITIYSNYLYAVGYFTIDGDTNLEEIARYDLYNGGWTPLGHSFTATNVVVPTTIAIDTNGWIYVEAVS